MGSVLSCENCFAGGTLSSEEVDAAKERILRLQKGDKFLRSALLGLSSQELLLKLSDDMSKIEWKVVNNTWSSNEWGEFDLTTQVKTLKLLGQKGMQLISTKDDGKVLLEVQSEEAPTRDHWVLSINELLQDWAANPEHKPKSAVSAAGTSDKASYFKQREEDIKKKEKDAQDKKQQYMSGGMKYTALAMSKMESS